MHLWCIQPSLTALSQTVFNEGRHCLHHWSWPSENCFCYNSTLPLKSSAPQYESFQSEFLTLNVIYNVNKKVQLDATVCRRLFTAKSLYMFRASQRPSSGALKTVTATSGIGHNAGTAASFQRGLIRPRWKEVAVPAL